MLETIVVSKVNKYGVRVGDKQYNYSKKYDGPQLEVGQAIDAEIYTSDTGAKYINKVVEVKTEKVKPVEQKAAPSVTVSSSKPVTLPVASGRDFDKEARGKTLFGLIAALVQSPYLINSDDDEVFTTRVNSLADSFFKKIFPEG